MLRRTVMLLGGAGAIAWGTGEGRAGRQPRRVDSVDATLWCYYYYEYFENGGGGKTCWGPGGSACIVCKQ